MHPPDHKLANSYGAPPAPETRRVEAATELFTQFKKTLQSYRLYDPGHDIVQRFRGTLFQAVDAYLSAYGTLTVEVAPFQLTLDGQPVLEVDEREQALPRPLFMDGVQRLTFQQGIDDAELFRFVGLWDEALNAETSPDAEHTFTTRMWEMAFGHVQVTAVDTYAELSDDSDLQDNYQQLVTSLSGGTPGGVGAFGAGTGSGQGVDLPQGENDTVHTFLPTRGELDLLRDEALAATDDETLARQDEAEVAAANRVDDDECGEILGRLAGDATGQLKRIIRAIVEAGLVASVEEWGQLQLVAAEAFGGYVERGALPELAQLLSGELERVYHLGEHGVQRATALENVNAAMLHGDMLEAVTRALDDPESAPAAVNLLTMLPGDSVDRLLDLLPVPESDSGRDLLVRLISMEQPSSELLLPRIGEGTEESVIRTLLQLSEGLSRAERAQLEVAAMQHGGPTLRRELVRSLHPEEVAAHQSALRPFLADSDELVRRTLLRLFVPLRDSDLPFVVGPLLENPDVGNTERRFIIAALGTIGGDRSATLLIKLLRSRADVDLRVDAAAALGKTRSNLARAPLKELAGKLRVTRKLRQACKQALDELDARRSGR